MRKLHTHQMKAFYLILFKYLCASTLFFLFSSHLFAADILMGQYEFTTGANQLKATSVTQGITMGDIEIGGSTPITTNYTGDAVVTANWHTSMSIGTGRCINLSITKGSNTSEFNVNKFIVTLKRSTGNKIQINYGNEANTFDYRTYAAATLHGTSSYVAYTLNENVNTGQTGTTVSAIPAVTAGTALYFSIGTMSASNSEDVYIDKIEVWGTVTTTPAAPTITSITPGDSQLSVAFTAGGDGNSPISNYEYSINGGSSWTTPSPSVTTSPLTISSLTNGTAYNVQLRAVNALGSGTATFSTQGTPTSASVAPGAPSITSITSGNTQLSVAFSAGIDGGSAITNYEYSTDAGSTWTTRSPIATTSPILISSLINGTSYNVQIRALNAIGTGAATASTAGTPSTTPSAPTITAITTSSDTQLSVAFTAGATGGSAITNYMYSIDGGLNFFTRQTGTTASPIVITGLTSGTSYNVQIKAVNANGDGAATANTASTTFSFYEDFAGYDNSSNSNTTLGTLPTMTNDVLSSRVPGWAGNFLYQYKAGSPNLGTVCLGSTASDSAYITTPAMDLSQPFTLTFKARSLVNNAIDGRFNVYLDGTQLIYSGTNTTWALTQYTTPAFVGTASSKLTFTGRKEIGNEIIIDGIGISRTTCSSCDLTLSKDAALTISEDKTYTNLSLAPGAKLTLGAGTLTVSNGLRLESNALGTATIVDNNNSSPQAMSGTVQQYLTAERNWYTASPVTSGTAAGLSLGTSVQSYSESAKGWSILTGSDALVAGKGYVSVATTGTGNTGTLSFNGTFNTGTIAVPVTRSGVDKAGFNLVANPYPSYLDWSLVTADPLNANIGTTMWFRTKTAGNLYTFSTYNSAGNVAAANSATTTITKFIPPMQAFWIRVNSGTATTNLTFKNTMRAHKDDNGNTLKAPRLDNQLLVRLQVSNGTNSDETVVYFNSNAQNSFDTYDSQKMFNNNTLQPEIYTMAGSEQLVINGMSEVVNNTEIPLGFSTGTANNFTLATTELKNLNGTRVILKDKLNPTTETELSEGVAYNFSSQITTPTNDRFSLIFRAPGITTGIENTAKLNAQVFVNAANQITIVAPEKSNYAIYNAVGQLIENGTLNSGLQTANCKLQTGIFVVKVGNQSNRVIVK